MGRGTITLPAILLVVATGCTAGGAAPGAVASRAPEPATAPVDFFAVGTDAVFFGLNDGATRLDPAEAFLVGPHTAFAVGQVNTATAIEPETAARLHVGDLTAVPPAGKPEETDQPGWLAADGYEFLALRTRDLPATYRARLLSPGGAEIEVTIEAGDQTYQLDPRSVHGRTLDLGQVTVVLSVAQGADVVMVISDSGRAQSLSLRTGERGDDAMPIFYAAPRGSADGAFLSTFRVAGTAISEGDLGIGGELAGAGLHPYLPVLGWAAPGHAWLRVSLAGETWTLRGLIRVTAVVMLDTAGSFTLVGSGGATAAAEPIEIAVPFQVPGFEESSVGGPLVFEVPVGFRSGTITFSPQGTVAAGAEKGTVSSALPSSVGVQLKTGPR